MKERDKNYEKYYENLSLISSVMLRKLRLRDKKNGFLIKNPVQMDKHLWKKKNKRNTRLNMKIRPAAASRWRCVNDLNWVWFNFLFTWYKYFSRKNTQSWRNDWFCYDFPCTKFLLQQIHKQKTVKKPVQIYIHKVILLRYHGY